MNPCKVPELCIEKRREPSHEETLGAWSKDRCMNCKLGIERERDLARARPITPDTSCIFCYEPMSIRHKNGRPRRYPVCSACFGVHLSNWGAGVNNKRYRDVEAIIEEARKI